MKQFRTLFPEILVVGYISHNRIYPPFVYRANVRCKRGFKIHICIVTNSYIIIVTMCIVVQAYTSTYIQYNIFMYT